MANKVSDEDSSVYEVEASTTETYTIDSVDSEIATLEANIVSYQERIDYLKKLKTEMLAAGVTE